MAKRYAKVGRFPQMSERTRARRAAERFPCVAWCGRSVPRWAWHAQRGLCGRCGLPARPRPSEGAEMT